MTTKLGINTYEQPKPNIIYQDQFLSFAGGTLRTGIGKVYVGQLLSKASDGYLDKWIAATAITDEVMVADAGGSLKVFTGTLAHGNVQPGSLVVEATFASLAGGVAAAGVKRTMTDNGNGVLQGADGFGFIDYVTGRYHLVYDTAPSDDTNITGTYKYYNTGHAGTIRPIGILSADEDATDAATKCSYYKTGHFWGKKLTPDISADTYSKDELTKIGIYTV